MKLKNLALWGAVLLVFAAFTVNNASAQDVEWEINGKVTAVGSADGSVVLEILDDGGNFWRGPATTSQDAEILATGLEAIASDLDVTGFFNVDQLEWNGLVVRIFVAAPSDAP